MTFSDRLCVTGQGLEYSLEEPYVKREEYSICQQPHKDFRCHAGLEDHSVIQGDLEFSSERSDAFYLPSVVNVQADATNFVLFLGAGAGVRSFWAPQVRSP